MKIKNSRKKMSEIYSCQLITEQEFYHNGALCVCLQSLKDCENIRCKTIERDVIFTLSPTEKIFIKNK